MKFGFQLFFWYALIIGQISAPMTSQNTVISGRVLDVWNAAPIGNALVELRSDPSSSALTDQFGYFSLSVSLASIGNDLLTIRHEHYDTQYASIFDDDPKRPIVIFLQWSISEDLPTLDPGFADLNDEGSYELPFESGPLKAKRDAFSAAAAYDFSGVFYAPRGAESTHKEMALQGITMNDLFTGQVLWDSFSGLNDAFRQRTQQEAFDPNDYNFGTLGGRTNINLRASHYKPGLKLKAIFSSKTYTQGYAVFYRSGLKNNGWSYAFALSSRYGDGGFVEGNKYDGQSIFMTLERQLANKASIILTGLYTPTSKGVGTPLTKEVLALKGPRYNPSWGLLNGRIRNSKTRRTMQPIFILSYRDRVQKPFYFQCDLGGQFGLVKRGRLNYNGSTNPFKHYYQNLPSYYLRESPLSGYDYQMAYFARESIINSGQLDWARVYLANTLGPEMGSAYVIQSDVQQKQMLIAQALFKYQVSDVLGWSAKVWLRRDRARHYGQLEDLLGGEFYLDLNSFYRGSDALGKWNDRSMPNLKHTIGSKIDYNHEWIGKHYGIYSALEYKQKNWHYMAAIEWSRMTSQRNGLFQNGSFSGPGQSLGPSQEMSFDNFKIKLSGAINWSPRSFTSLNAVSLSAPPIARNTFVNIRQSNEVVHDIKSSLFNGIDIDWRYQGKSMSAKVSGFIQSNLNETKVKTYYTQHAIAAPDGQALVHEVTQGIDTRCMGLQAGLSYDLSHRLVLSTALVHSRFVYSNDPLLYLSGDAFADLESSDTNFGSDLFILGRRKVFVQDYAVSRGPRAIKHLKLQYRDPKYWWASLSFNHFSGRVADISFLRRSEDAYLNQDGVLNPFAAAQDPSILLRQEQMNDVVLCHFTAGKSWRIDGAYLSLFFVVNNLFDATYLSGGFENSRVGSITAADEEANRPGGALFGNRYFSGMGRSFYGSITLSL